MEHGTLTSHGGGIVATSSGVGPAIVDRIEVLVDGKPQREWSGVLHALGYAPGQLHVTQVMLYGNVLPPGKSMYWFTVFGQPAWKDFLQKVNRHVVIHVCYRSALRDSWMASLKNGGLWSSTPVASCASIPGRDEFDG